MAKADAVSMDVRLHPLVVMSIADHYTRNVEQYRRPRAVGALFGVQSGRDVHIYDTIEMGLTEEKLDTQHFQEDMKLYKAAFPAYECLGWYSTGADCAPQQGDTELHESMCEFNERPFFLVFDPKPRPDARDLPVALYEEEVVVLDDRTKKQFLRAPFKVQADEAERISAVHCAKVAVGHTGGSAVVPHYQTLCNSVKALRERITLLHKFVTDVDKGVVVADQSLLRAINEICNRLPTMDSPQFFDDALNEYNDALLVTQLAMITQGLSLTSEAVERFNLAHGSNVREPKIKGRLGPLGPFGMGHY